MWSTVEWSGVEYLWQTKQSNRTYTHWQRMSERWKAWCTLVFIKIVIHIKYLWITGQKYMERANIVQCVCPFFWFLSFTSSQIKHGKIKRAIAQCVCICFSYNMYIVHIGWTHSRDTYTHPVARVYGMRVIFMFQHVYFDCSYCTHTHIIYMYTFMDVFCLCLCMSLFSYTICFPLQN